MPKNLVGLLEISSSSVAGGLVNFSDEENSSPRIIAAAENKIDFHQAVDLERLFDLILNTVRQTLADLVKKQDLSPRDFPKHWHCFLGAPFHVSQTRTVRLERPESFLVTPKLVNGIVDEEIKKFKEARPQLFSELLNDEPELIQSSVMKIKLNGYDDWPHPYGARAKALELEVYLSIGSRQLLRHFREAIAATIAVKELRFHPFSFAFFAVFRDLTPSRNDSALLIDLDGELTELSLVVKDVLTETASFPLGINSLVRELAVSLKTVNEEALSSLKLWLAGRAAGGLAERLEKALWPIKTNWLNSFAKLLDALLDHYLPNDQVFLFGEQSLLPLYRSWLKDLPSSETVLGGKNLSINIFQDKIFSNRILTAAIFFDKLNKLKN